MEYTQWETACVKVCSLMSLNPCCNGIYSMSEFKFYDFTIEEVLILVVMEYTQWEEQKKDNDEDEES